MAERFGERVKELMDRGMLMVEIARELNLHESQVSAAARYWYESRGLRAPDGRARLSGLSRRTCVPPKYQRISSEAGKLYQQGMTLGEIAQKLQVDRATLDMALKCWARSSGQSLINGRARRKQLGADLGSQPQAATG